MIRVEVGTRVAVLASFDEYNKKTHLYGFGTYEGEEIPPPGIGVNNLGQSCSDIGAMAAKLKLDDGTIIWGCECSWGPEAEVKEEIAGSEIIKADLFESRAGLPRRGPLTADSTRPCAACNKSLKSGDYYAEFKIGPGEDKAARESFRLGKPTELATVQVHYACATGYETL